jgi:uncharacterized SAM-binding protein YcdF (DUF218 family)
MDVLRSLATPVGAVLAFLATGLALTRFVRRKRLCRIGWYSMLAGTALLLSLSLKPVAEWLAYSLENRYQLPTDDALQGLDIVAVLGGGMYPSGPLQQEAELGEETYPRLYQGVKYFKRSSARMLAFCGGSPRRGTESEAEVMGRVAMEMGVSEQQIVVETHSRNTMENLANLASLLPPGRGRRIGLVTSATHMPRSARVFRSVFPHDELVPMPVHYTYDPVSRPAQYFIPSSNHFKKSCIAVHEWIGLLWYEIRY